MISGPQTFGVRPVTDSERGWLDKQLRESWGSTEIVSRGQVHDATRLPALLCHDGDRSLGFATFHVEGGECELVTLDSLSEGIGVGSALLAAVTSEARRRGCHRLWLITTNDNLRALRFYQRRGFRLAAVYPGAVDAARESKPSIPFSGNDGIPIHDELELEVALDEDC